MELQYMSGGLNLDRTGSGGGIASIPSWLSTGWLPLFLRHTGDNSAGNGGNGSFAGSLLNDGNATLKPLSLAEAGANATADAHQTNTTFFHQTATQIAGAGGDGGNQNVALGGSIGVHGSIGSDVIASGGNGAGNGGDGHFAGAAVDSVAAIYSPVDVAVAGYHATASADQTNTVHFDQGATQIAGVGGQGGNGNAAKGGDISASAVGLGSDHGSVGSDLITSGGNSAGNGGDGSFSGSLIHDSIAVYDPINIAVAGSSSSAYTNQTNNVDFNQGATQIAGVGGQGGNGNAAIGGDISASGGQGSDHGMVGSDVIASGGNSAGNGGDGSFFGSLVHELIAVYDPINIAVAGSNSIASADHNNNNNVDFNQAGIQMAGVGGQGGNDNAAVGGSISAFGVGQGSSQGSIGSDVIMTGANSAGDGGAGHFSGSIVDVSVAIYAPINIAVAGSDSTANADQSNNVHFDQSAIQIAGVGGNGGHGNLALGGDIALQLLADHHLLSHAV